MILEDPFYVPMENELTIPEEASGTLSRRENKS